MTGSQTPFTANIRSRPGIAVRLGEPGDAVLTFRVEVPEVWDVVRVQAPASEPVLSVKVRALEALYPAAEFHENFVVKLNGFEVLDENASLADTGVVDGSILLVTHRRRRAVRG